ncbi:hypothetical protein BV25DRAFT_1922196 [Artomyces pyxidatus]|uniref:Uncharacterized protein n=1 Tax=Artomyces pyxidatus TaxID=48021 RepID=A0ACB8SFI7_9AGAM|nr:hypothetical protein BV25DRAFT_1922196 [Artomyces pyxidatus]
MRMQEEQDEGQQLPPALVPVFFQTWQPNDEDSGDDGDDNLELLLSQVQISEGADPAQVVSPREANAQLPRPMEDKFYAVFVGRKLGVMSTLWEAEAAVRGIPDGFYDIYPSHADALENFRVAERQGATALRGTPRPAHATASGGGSAAQPLAPRAEHSTAPPPPLFTEENSAGQGLPRHEDTRVYPAPSQATLASSIRAPSPPPLASVIRPPSPPQPSRPGLSPAAALRKGTHPLQNYPSESRRHHWRRRRPELTECARFENGQPGPSDTWDEFKAYAVVQGMWPGIHESWDECKAFTHNVPGAIHKSFRKYDEAVDYFLEKFEAGEVRFVTRG